MRQDLYAELFEEESRHFWHVAKRALVLQALERIARPGSRILELGCGAGKLQEELGRRAYEAWGSDLEPEALAWCARRGLERVFLHDASKPVPEDKGSFDAVLAVDLLEHLDDDATALAEWRRALRPGGRLVLHVPAHPSLYSYWDEMLGHRRRYTADTLAERLRAAGFVVERLTPTFAWLVLPAALFRKVLRRRSDASTTRSDFKVQGRLLGVAGRAFGWLETRWLRWLDLPFGLSLLAVARREDAR